ncbi:hypothetical protein TRIATDRAFT_91988 [Trichoderma atroviride IMI 206040]|uniref:Apple domain-containing protein n=1 Tax=Hypocrea atroviridis (strain ATCC 20476 / IMI 206040) TaxID=452589 RepID=G9PBY6_HYPAI|nr:uncharacterized protein TRIATDRAFT_91988 [Trichoderma atroviride IMI 206040]EHK39369.1 hypothetical protein TRIATDRAFT_91988 [Trichoderma atroviride IMI 206040]
MKTALQVLAVLPFLATSVVATNPVTTCRTELGTKSTNHVSTVTKTSTSSHQPTTTLTIRPTVTSYVGLWYTVTGFATKTKTVTDSTVTDTFSTTSTVFAVETDTITATVTTTTTNTDTTSSTSTTVSTVHPVTETIFYWRETTKTNTLTSTKTVVPADVSSTITSTYTSSVTTFTTTFETSTVTASTTTTAIIPGPTVYDACSALNTFGPNFSNSGRNYYAVNVANNGPGVGSDFSTVADGATTATDCCNACQQFGTCETFIFRPRNRNCFLLYHPGETCSSQFNHPNFILSISGSDTGEGYVVGNGNCGYTYSGNSDGTVFPAYYVEQQQELYYFNIDVKKISEKL